MRSTKRKLTKADVEARELMIRNADRLRQLALKAQAELDRKKRDAPAAESS